MATNTATAVPPTDTPTVVSPMATNTATDTATAVLPTAEPATVTSPERKDRMKITLTLADTVITATLNDSQTSRDFASLLPLTVTLEDYAGTEKISSLPKKLSTEDAPPGNDPAIGDITYYAPWGNLAIFYQDFGYANGLVPLGKIDNDIQALNVPGSLKVTIELLD
jgi:hypothetical protein